MLAPLASGVVWAGRRVRAGHYLTGRPEPAWPAPAGGSSTRDRLVWFDESGLGHMTTSGCPRCPARARFEHARARRGASLGRRPCGPCRSARGDAGGHAAFRLGGGPGRRDRGARAGPARGRRRARPGPERRLAGAGLRRHARPRRRRRLAGQPRPGGSGPGGALPPRQGHHQHARQHRHLGTVGAALSRGEVICELVNDGVHLRPEVVRLVFQAAGAERVALVTDAIAAAGMADGDYDFGRVPLRVRGGVARLVDGRTIAGSTLTMDAALRRAVQEVGIPMGDAVTAASSTPARVIGIGERAGSIEPGKAADLVVLDDDLEVTAVMAAGRWVRRQTPPKPLPAAARTR